MQKKPADLLVFTDMDGSLLDHYTYSHAAADTLLASLAKHGVPVIANTSKTRKELEALRHELDNTHPFIAENGAAVFLPKHAFPQQPDGTEDTESYWVKAFSPPRQHWQSLIQQQAAGLNTCFQTFADAGIDGIAKMTGLSIEKAQLAAEREYGEPIQWLGTDDEANAFFSLLEQQGAQILRGWRFSHVSGHCDKGIALQWLHAHYQQALGKTLTTIALGDSQNDVAMLDAADYAIIIQSPVHAAPTLLTATEKQSASRLVTTSATGPEGWVQGITVTLNQLGIKLP